jgi:predicted SnoaL-like aldol condensation-catalyzing enzyme
VTFLNPGIIIEFGNISQSERLRGISNTPGVAAPHVGIRNKMTSSIQHSAHIEPGRDGLFNLIKAAPPSLTYEPGVILAEGDYVIVQGRFSNIGLPVNWIAADIVRLKDGILVEHWDVIQDEVTEQQSKSGNPMFGESFPK